MGVTDGVNVLRSAAGLPVTLSCVADPFIATVQGENGIFGALTKIPGGLTAPPGAPQTVKNVLFGDGFVAGRVNTITVEYDVGAAQAQGVTAGTSLLIASAHDSTESSPGFFDLPLDSGQGAATIALDLKPDIPVQQFTLKIANGADGRVLGQIFPIIIVIITPSTPTCGNRVLDGGETCDPPGFGCPFASGGGFCNAACSCEVPTRFIDNGDGTLTDNSTGLMWEKKTGTVGIPRDCSRTPCPDPHDVNNSYDWCRDLNHYGYCDTVGYPPNGGVFTDFLPRLNTPPCFASHCDWRLPRVNRDGGTAELETIVDPNKPGCGNGIIPCIDPVFGPTVANYYWSAGTHALYRDCAWSVQFDTGNVQYIYKYFDLQVRAVRTLP